MSAILELDTYFSKELIHYSNFTEYNIVLHHFGSFSRDLVNGLTETVESIMIENNDSKKSIKRVFTILIEGLQNIINHGEKNELGEQPAYLIVMSNNDNYRIVMGNYVNHIEVNQLDNYLKRLNDLPEVELKELYMNVLNNNLFSSKGGAGLGFLTMRIKSENPITYRFEKVNEVFSFFTYEIVIKKSL